MISESLEKKELLNPFYVMLGLLRFSAFIIVMLAFLIVHSCLALLIRDEKQKLKVYLKSIPWFAQLGLLVLNVKVSLHGLRGEVKQRLIVANHLSYLDVLILSAFYPALFITSVEIKETFLLGKLTELAGCFFVERRKEKRLASTKEEELSDMAGKLQSGHNIFLFPEGTSSDGCQVLPFKATFFQLAVDADLPVLPLTLSYSGAGRDAVPWYGKMTFPDHLLKLCMQKEINAHVIRAEEVKGSDRFELARITQNIIRTTYEKY